MREGPIPFEARRGARSRPARAAGGRTATGATPAPRRGRSHCRRAHRPRCGAPARPAARRWTSPRTPSLASTGSAASPGRAARSWRPCPASVRRGPPSCRRRSRSDRRLLADWPAGRWSIRSPRDVADRLVLQMGRLEREELRVVILNTKNAVLRVVTAYQGNVSASLVRVGELFRDAVRLDAAGVDPRPQPPVGRPDAVTGRPAPDGGGARGGSPPGHRRAGPPRDRPRRLRLAARSRHRLRPRSARRPPPAA